MCLCCVDLWHPKLFEKVALQQNGHWKPELLRARGIQQLWLLADVEAEMVEINQEG